MSDNKAEYRWVAWKPSQQKTNGASPTFTFLEIKSMAFPLRPLRSCWKSHGHDLLQLRSYTHYSPGLAVPSSLQSYKLTLYDFRFCKNVKLRRTVLHSYWMVSCRSCLLNSKKLLAQFQSWAQHCRRCREVHPGFHVRNDSFVIPNLMKLQEKLQLAVRGVHAKYVFL